MQRYKHICRVCKNLNPCNGDGDAGVTVIALHILRIVELKIAHFCNVMSIEIRCDKEVIAKNSLTKLYEMNSRSKLLDTQIIYYLTAKFGLK